MKHVYGYTRVSTVKQGEHGVSLQEQRAAIESYCVRNDLTVGTWFEEKETAAKRGRPVFTRMLALLKARKSDGVVIHKIDRSARNLRDWADLGELIDCGVEVHFANESLDLHSRGGRLSADIQAVMAADYIRNLREEVKKGFYGRLKQGVYPLPAPLGYLDCGAGKPKQLDPLRAPLVRLAFELYGTGTYNLFRLVDELHRRGLRNRNGGKVSKSGLAVILNNPFYIGLIRVKRTGETFAGAHSPLIREALYDRVHDVLTGKVSRRIRKHDFLFRRLLKCAYCNYSLIGETQKGHTYYRCHTTGCPTTAVREDMVEKAVANILAPIGFSGEDWAKLQSLVAGLKEQGEQAQTEEVNSLVLVIAQIKERLGRLIDAYVDRLIEKPLFEERKATLLMEQRSLEEKLDEVRTGGAQVPGLIAEFLEHARSVYATYISADYVEKRDLLKSVTSNRAVAGKKLEIFLKSPFKEVAESGIFLNSPPHRATTRICSGESAVMAATTTNHCGQRTDVGKIFTFLKSYYERGIEK